LAEIQLRGRIRSAMAAETIGGEKGTDGLGESTFEIGFGGFGRGGDADREDGDSG